MFLLKLSGVVIVLTAVFFIIHLIWGERIFAWYDRVQAEIAKEDARIRDMFAGDPDGYARYLQARYGVIRPNDL